MTIDFDNRSSPISSPLSNLGHSTHAPMASNSPVGNSIESLKQNNLVLSKTQFFNHSLKYHVSKSFGFAYSGAKLAVDAIFGRMVVGSLLLTRDSGRLFAQASHHLLSEFYSLFYIYESFPEYPFSASDLICFFKDRRIFVNHFIGFSFFKEENGNIDCQKKQFIEQLNLACSKTRYSPFHITEQDIRDFFIRAIKSEAKFYYDQYESPRKINDTEVRCSYISLLNLLFDYVKFDHPDDGEMLCRFALISNSPQLIEEIPRKLPHVIARFTLELASLTTNDLMYFCNIGHLNILEYLIQNHERLGIKIDYAQVSLVLVAQYKHVLAHKSIDTKEEFEQFYRIFNLLLDPLKTLELATRKNAFTRMSLLEEIYFHAQSYNEPAAWDIFELLLKKGIHLSKKIASALIIEVKRTKEARFAHHLIKQGYLKEQEWEAISQQKGSHATSDLNTLCLSLYEFNTKLETWLTHHRFTPFLVPLQEIRQLLSLKKETKRQLALPLPDAERQRLDQIYDQVKQKYRVFALQHPLFSELKAIKQEIMNQKAQEASYEKMPCRVRRFYSIWSDNKIYEDEILNKVIWGHLSNEKEKRFWFAKMSENLLNALEKIQMDPLLSKHSITWVHGTKSTSIPSILQQKGLVPLGKLIERGIAPFSGEISGAPYNQIGLSGEMLTRSWEEGDGQNYFGLSTRLMVSLHYSSKKRAGFEHKMEFNIEQSWQRLTPDLIEKIIQEKTERDKLTKVSLIKVDILRVRMSDPEFERKIEPLKIILEKASKESPNDPILQSISQTFYCPLPFIPSPEDREKWLAKSFPVVFASLTSSPLFVWRPENKSYALEFLASEKMLGQDLQYAFTENEHVNTLQQALLPFDMKVYPFDAAFALETLNMIRGSRSQEFSKLSLGKKISKHLQSDILPHYAIPFPQKPKYREGKETLFIENPHFGVRDLSHSDYLQMIQDAEILPRTVHGLMHACRTALWTQALLMGIYVKLGRIQVDDQLKFLLLRFFLALTGGAHDCAREDEGRDRWDQESAESLRGYLLNISFQVDEIEPFIHAITHKDAPVGQITSFIQGIMRDADCLEIKRCLKQPSDFRTEELFFYGFEELDRPIKSHSFKRSMTLLGVRKISN